jgi:UbiD family decarboxylase
MAAEEKQQVSTGMGGHDFGEAGVAVLPEEERGARRPHAYHDFREFMKALEEHGELRTVDAPIAVDREDTELDALTRYLQDTDGPAVALTNLVGLNMPDVPIINNLYGSRRRVALALGETDPRETMLKIIEARNSTWPDPVVLDHKDVPEKEVVIKGDDIDLRRDFPKAWFQGERQVYLTTGLSFTKDPEGGLYNMGSYRYGMLDLDPEGKPYSEDLQKRHLTAYVWWNPPITDIGLHFYNAVQRGEPLEVAMAFQNDPALAIAAGTTLPTGQFEASFAGALRGAPIEMVKCETVDLEVPAWSEWVLEGELLPGTEELDGPHGNYLGYYDPEFGLPLMKVNCITRRKDPMMWMTYEMMPPFDHAFLAEAQIKAEIMAEIMPRFPHVHDLAIHPVGWGNIYVVQLSVDGADKPAYEYGRFVIHAVWGSTSRWARQAKYVIVVGPDVDPFDMSSVAWALSTRVQPLTDAIQNPKGAALLDPSAPRGPQGNTPVSEQIAFDATIKVPERFDEYAEVAEARPELVAQVAEKLQALDL